MIDIVYVLIIGLALSGFKNFTKTDCMATDKSSKIRGEDSLTSSMDLPNRGIFNASKADVRQMVNQKVACH